MNTLQSYIGGRWIGTTPAQTLKSAINGRPVAATHAEALDFAEAVQYARRVGGPALMKTDFQQRAGILKALAKLLIEKKELLYAISAALVDLHLDLILAKIVTERGAAIDSFYVTEIGGGKILDADRRDAVARYIQDAISNLD